MKNRIIMRSICFGALMLLAPQYSGEAAVTAEFSDYETGGDIKAEVERTDENALEISFDTLGEEEDTYSAATVFFQETVKTEQGGSVRIRLENKQTDTARMNINLIDDEGNAFQIKDGCYVMLTGTANGAVKTENESFELPAGFSGEAEILTDSMEAIGGTGETCAGTLDGYGIVCIAEGGKEYQIELQQVQFLSEEEALPEDTLAELVMEGADTVLNPEIGMSKAYYGCYAVDMLGNKTDNAYRLALSKETDGVTLSEDGWLSVEAGTQAEEVVLEAETDDDAVQAEKTVTLKRAWTTSVLTAAGYDASVAKPEEIAPIIDGKVWNVLEIALWVLRIGGITGVIIFFAYYLHKRRRES